MDLVGVGGAFVSFAAFEGGQSLEGLRTVLELDSLIPVASNAIEN
jgi:hypothetical protein